MTYRLPALLLLSVTLLSACGGAGPDTPIVKDPPKETVPVKPPPVKPPPANAANTANFTFKASGSPTASLAPLTGANGAVGGNFDNPDSSTGISGGLAVVYETMATGRIVDRTLGIFFRNKTTTFKVGDRLPLYNIGRFILADQQPDGASVIYGETYRTGDRQSDNWDSVSGTLIVSAISPTAIKFTLENAVLSRDIFKENDPDKFTIYGTMTYDPRPR